MQIHMSKYAEEDIKPDVSFMLFHRPTVGRDKSTKKVAVCRQRQETERSRKDCRPVKPE